MVDFCTMLGFEMFLNCVLSFKLLIDFCFALTVVSEIVGMLFCLEHFDVFLVNV